MSDERAPELACHLQRIADVLGCPVAAFYGDDGMPVDLAARRGLLALWDALKTDAGRQEVLRLIRNVAANE